MENNIDSWSGDANYRLANRKWLRYSSNIARRVLAVIEDKDSFSQANLARMLGVSQQQVSKIVKGQENLTLKTIAAISTVLDTELISFPDYKYSTNAFRPAESSSTKSYVEKLQVAYKSHEAQDNNLSQTKSKEESQNNSVPITIRGEINKSQIA